MRRLLMSPLLCRRALPGAQHQLPREGSSFFFSPGHPVIQVAQPLDTPAEPRRPLDGSHQVEQTVAEPDEPTGVRPAMPHNEERAPERRPGPIRQVEPRHDPRPTHAGLGTGVHAEHDHGAHAARLVQNETPLRPRNPTRTSGTRPPTTGPSTCSCPHTVPFVTPVVPTVRHHAADSSYAPSAPSVPSASPAPPDDRTRCRPCCPLFRRFILRRSKGVVPPQMP